LSIAPGEWWSRIRRYRVVLGAAAGIRRYRVVLGDGAQGPGDGSSWGAPASGKRANSFIYCLNMIGAVTPFKGTMVPGISFKRQMMQVQESGVLALGAIATGCMDFLTMC